MGLGNWISKKLNNFKEWISETSSNAYQTTKEKTKQLIIKLCIIGLIIIGLYLLFLWLKPYFFEFLKSHPTLNAIYEHITFHMANWTYLGLFYLSFLGSLFFLPIPAEATIIQYIHLNKSIILITLISTIGGVLGLLFNYFCGRLVGEKALKYFLKDNYEKMKGWVEKYGAFFLLIGAIFPSPLELVCLIYGGVKYSFKKFIIYTTIGRVIKVLMLYFLLDWITTVVIPYFKSFF